MCKAQVNAKRERQNDDYATTNTNPNSSSLNDEAHHIRRRLSQTITSRYCLLIAIALASLSAHACSDTVELQVTCDSGKTTWVVPSHITQTDDTTETNPQMVTVGSCIGGHVKNVAQVKGKDIDDNGIVICSQTDVCYHLKRSNDNQIEVKNCNGYGDSICNYICYGNLFTRKGEAKQDGTDREPINGNIICDGSTNNAYTYKCDGNIVKKTPCPLGCDENGNQCKTHICKSGNSYECKDGTLFKCGNAQDVATPVADNMACDEDGDVVFCDKNSVESAKHTCANDKVVFCDEKNNVKSETHPCADGKVAWCKPNEPTPLLTECLPSSPKDKLIACNDLNNSRRSCDENGKILPEESCSNDQTKCAGDLKGRIDCNGNNIDECQYCYNKNVNNTPDSIEELGCDGCVPNEYNFGDSSESLFNTMNSICHNGKKFDFNKNENSKFLSIPQLESNGVWEFALNVTLVQSEGQLQKPPTNQFPKPFQPTWRYYNCHNKAAMNSLTEHTKVNNVNDFLDLLKKSNKCCQDVNSYYITQTGYRYYSVEKCTNIALDDNGKNTATNFSAYAYTTELNDSLIGVEDDLLAKDYACLEVRDNPEDTNDVRHMMFIKQQPDGKSNYGIYKAFECPEEYECDLKNPYNGLCIYHEIDDIAKTIKECGNFKCNEVTNTISCGQTHFAACPKGTKLRIVGDNSKCEGKSNLKLDQIRCVPDGQSIAKQ